MKSNIEGVPLPCIKMTVAMMTIMTAMSMPVQKATVAMRKRAVMEATTSMSMSMAMVNGDGDDRAMAMIMTMSMIVGWR